MNTKQILAESIHLARHELKLHWPKFAPYADHQFTHFVQHAETLARLRMSGHIDDAELKARLNAHCMNVKNVLLTLQDVPVVTAQNVVNALLAIVAASVKSAFHVSII